MASSNPFFDAYIQADWLGKAIFLALFGLSLCSWYVIVEKILAFKKAKKNSSAFLAFFNQQKGNILSWEWEIVPSFFSSNPLYHLFSVLKKQTKEILQKNIHFTKLQGKMGLRELTLADISYIESHLSSSISLEISGLEKNLYLLSTAVSLGPFLGLLGTVWGILVTFADLQGGSLTASNQAVLHGLSLALATTVIGLIVAIPALVGYSYLKSSIRLFAKEMEDFSHQALSLVELQYRQVDLQRQNTTEMREKEMSFT